MTLQYDRLCQRFEIPDAGRSVLPPGHNELATGAEPRVVQLAYAFENGDLFESLSIPQTGRSIARGRQDPSTSGIEYRTADVSLMPPENCNSFVGIGIPDPGCLVRRGRDELFAVEPECRRINPTRMSSEHSNLRPGSSIPNSHRSIS